MKNNIKILLLGSTLLFSGCRDFLNEKSNSSLATPETLEDNQALLDRTFLRSQLPSSGAISADDFYVTDADFDNMEVEAEKRLYTWQPDRVATPADNDWGNTYQRIKIFNTVLNNLERYQISNSENVRGQALVFRGAAYLDAAQVWCLAYDPQSAQSRKGLPLRLDPDMNIPSVRATLQETYDQILKDLHEALPLLPPYQISPTRPSKATALGYLTRAYLYMGDYEKAVQYGNEALALHSTLMDFNLLDPSASFPVAELNVEALLPLTIVYSYFLPTSKAKIPVGLYDTYADNDLRKIIFFRKNNEGEVLFKGNYSGTSLRSAGLASDEVYLTVAESYARINQPAKAIQLLNQLLITRWRTGTYIPYATGSAEEVLQIIRQERRKELLMRGLRWADLKRYNRDGANIVLTRVIKGATYTLPANDLRYAVAIPEDIIEMTGMPQNDR